MDVSLLFAKIRIGSVFINDGDKTVGIVTETDLVRKVMANSLVPEDANVSSFMSTTLICISPDELLTEAGEIMDQHKIRHLCAKDNGKLVGVLSVRDIIHPGYYDGEGY